MSSAWRRAGLAGANDCASYCAGMAQGKVLPLVALILRIAPLGIMARLLNLAATQDAGEIHRGHDRHHAAARGAALILYLVIGVTPLHCRRRPRTRCAARSTNRSGLRRAETESSPCIPAGTALHRES